MAATSPPVQAELPRKRRKSTRWGADEEDEPASAPEPAAPVPAPAPSAADEGTTQIRARPKRRRFEPLPEDAAEPKAEPEAPSTLPPSLLQGLIGTADAVVLGLHRRLGEVSCSLRMPAVS